MTTTKTRFIITISTSTTITIAQERPQANGIAEFRAALRQKRMKQALASYSSK